jgi:hypothetical protein
MNQRARLPVLVRGPAYEIPLEVRPCLGLRSGARDRPGHGHGIEIDVNDLGFVPDAAPNLRVEVPVDGLVEVGEIDGLAAAEGVVALEIEVVQAALVDLDLGAARLGKIELEAGRGAPAGLDQARAFDDDVRAGSGLIIEQMIGVGAAARRIDALPVDPRHDGHTLVRLENLSGFVDGQKGPLLRAGIRAGTMRPC